MNWRGDNLALHVFGASHSEVIGMTLYIYYLGIDYMAFNGSYLENSTPKSNCWIFNGMYCCRWVVI